MRSVMTIEPKWLVELAPRFFRQADAGQLSKAKRRQKIEPLYDRFNPEGSWRCADASLPAASLVSARLPSRTP